MSAPAIRARARKQPERAANRRRFALESDEIALVVSLCELFALNSRFGWGCADLP